MKKVFQIVPNRWTSGLEKVVMNICTLVPGYDFTYVVPHGPIEKDLKDRNIKYIGIDNITPISIRKIIKKYNPDIVHGHDVKASLCLAFNHKLCKKRGIKIISELHNDDYRMHKLSLRSILYKISSKSYDCIVLVSKKILDSYVFKESIDDKSIIIHNVVNPKISTKINSNVQKSDFLFLGRLEYQKNPEKFISFIKKIKLNNPDVFALMIGKGNLEGKIIDLINKNGLQKNIKMMGYINNPYPYVSNTKAVVITSRYEGICLVALEAMMLKTPVITTDVTGVQQLVDNSCGVKSNSLTDLVEYGDKLLSDNAFLNAISQGSYKHSKKVNNIDAFVSSYVNLYK